MSTILISGGSSASPPLDAASDDSADALPVIPAGKSTLESLAGGIPELISSATVLMNRMSEAFSDENVENLRSSMESMAKISSSLAAEGESLHLTLQNLHQACERLNRLLEDADQVITGEVKAAAVSWQRAFDRLNALIARLEPELLKISGSGAEGLGKLLLDTRMLVRNLDKMVRELSLDPRGFLFGNSLPEYQPR
jgi:ABC-type transporter Mla subunit MlaD